MPHGIDEASASTDADLRLLILGPGGEVMSHSPDLAQWLGVPPGELAQAATATLPGVVVETSVLQGGATALVFRRRAADMAGLRRENHLLRETLDAIDGTVVVYDADLRFLLANAAYFDMFTHLPRDGSLVGRTYAEILADSITAHRVGDQRAYENPAAFIVEREAEVRLPREVKRDAYHPERERWVRIQSKWTPSGNRVALRIDITAIRRLQEELEGAERLKTVGRIAGGVAHNFNNILTVICGNLDLMLSSPDMTSALSALARRAMASADAGARLTRQLLIFAQRDLTHPQPAAAHMLLTQVHGLLRGVAGPDMVVEMDLTDREGMVCVDRTQFEAAMVNVVLNARDAITERRLTRQGDTSGRIIIRLTAPPVRADEVRMIRVSVTDNGCGMLPEVAAEAFEPFFTTKHPNVATGLGLSQVQGFVASAGGHASIESAPGVGTTITLFLPWQSSDPMD